MKRSLIALALVSSFVVAGVANAATTTANFHVTIHVDAGCEFKASSIQDLGFGSVAASPLTGTAAVTTADTKFKIQCTVGTAPMIALSSLNSWKMKGSDANNTSATVGYALFSDSTRMTAWNETDIVTGVDTGAENEHIVYGKVTDPGRVAGNFKDVVTVTLTY